MLMTPGNRSMAVDSSESLQADVMRFMAIIGFCLIAILALVKNVEPATESQPPSASSKPIPAELEPAPETTVAPIEPPIVAPVTVKEPEAAITAPDPVWQQPAQTEPAPAEPAPAPAPATPPEDPGLILRFASDGDFLRLIARGDIKVYAFHETDVLTLSANYRFLDTSSPGQVYELLLPSIPSLIIDALADARTDFRSFRWGIALPANISSKIQQHLGTVTRGQLVIDRYGDVHHVAAS